MARAAEGSLRDGLSLLEQARAYCGSNITDAQVRELLGVVPEEILDELTGAIRGASADRVLSLVHRLLAEGQNLQHFCREAIGHFRNLLVARVCGADSELIAAPADERPRLKKAVGIFQRGRPHAIFSNSAAHGRRSAPQARCAPASGDGPVAHGECRAPRAARRTSCGLEGGTPAERRARAIFQRFELRRTALPPASVQRSCIAAACCASERSGCVCRDNIARRFRGHGAPARVQAAAAPRARNRSCAAAVLRMKT